MAEFSNDCFRFGWLSAGTEGKQGGHYANSLHKLATSSR